MHERPNVVLLMCDQLSSRILSCYGGRLKTPNIERLAREGFVFEHATCTTPICSPSRGSIVTGKYPHVSGLVDNVFLNEYPVVPGDWVDIMEEGITERDVTTEQILHANGYSTHHYGKWHLMGEELSYFPDMYREHHGYADEMQSFFEAIRQSPRESYMNWYEWLLPIERSEPMTRAVENLHGAWDQNFLVDFLVKMGRLDMDEKDTFDYRIATKTVERIQKSAETPFMVTASFNWPHDPNIICEPYYSLFTPEDMVFPDGFDCREEQFESSWSRRIVKELGEDGLREFMRIYYGCTMMIDRQVGRILDALDQAGLADNTVVLFLSDHGDLCGAHGMVWKSTNAFYDELTQVPLIIRYPNGITPGRSGIPVSLCDIMPTILELTGQRIPEDIDGKSLVRFMRDETAQPDSPYVFCERVTWSESHTRNVTKAARGSFMVRGGGYKYCSFAGGEEYLYHLESDPNETENVLNRPEHADAYGQMRAELERWLKKTGYIGTWNRGVRV